jgi:hypothetical protein
MRRRRAVFSTFSRRLLGISPAAAMADDRVDSVSRLDEVEAFLDLPLQVTVAQVTGRQSHALAL